MKAVEKKELIKWQQVDAIGIEKIGYDFGHKTLYVKFRRNENIYLYLDVDEHVYEDLIKQEHKTTYVNKVIKENYDYHIL